MPDPSPGEAPETTPELSTGYSASKFKAPDTSLIIFGIIVLAAVLTWVIPPGSFERDVIEVQGVGEREVVIPGSFAWAERPEVSIAKRFSGTVALVLQAPIRGFVDPEAAPIIAFVLLIGGAFSVLTATGAIDAALRRLVVRARASRALEVALIPLFMTLFSLGGAVFGMSEETIPFILIFVPLALALGYDTVTGVAIPFVGASAGFAAAFLNPFTVGVAQGIAGVALFSGVPFRLGLWVITTAVAIGFVTWHARRVKANPSISPVAEIDRVKRAEGMHLEGAAVSFTGRQRATLAVFLGGIAVLVFGVMQYGWYIIEIAALFIGLAAVMGGVGGSAGTALQKRSWKGSRSWPRQPSLLVWRAAFWL